MSKMENFKIIMVNSFKGGTGKTSVALSHCIYEWKRSQERLRDNETYYDSIYFVDIDCLGTSMSYYLFPKEKEESPVYFEEYKRTKAVDICNKVELFHENDNCNLYAVLLNPVANRRQDYCIHGRMHQHGRIYNTIFLRDILAFIEECMEMGKNSLFVIDCSPGLSEMEFSLLGEFYMLKEKYKGKYLLLVEELYVTTFENGQVQKTVDSLNDNRDLMYREGREVSIVLNDIQNCIELTKGDGVFRVDWENVAQTILDGLLDKDSVKIRYRKYQARQMKAGLVGNAWNLNDTTDAYMLLKEYREDYISKDGMDKK